MLTIKIIVVDRTREKFLEQGEIFYLKRLERYAHMDWVIVKPARIGKGIPARDVLVREGDAIAVADYDGDGTPDPTIFRQDNGLWAVRGSIRSYFGRVYDRGIPADFSGDGTAGIGIFRESSGLWAVHNLTRVYWGRQSDLPLAR
jgi:hypothetical protein